MDFIKTGTPYGLLWLYWVSALWLDEALPYRMLRPYRMGWWGSALWIAELMPCVLMRLCPMDFWVSALWVDEALPYKMLKIYPMGCRGSALKKNVSLILTGLGILQALTNVRPRKYKLNQIFSSLGYTILFEMQLSTLLVDRWSTFLPIFQKIPYMTILKGDIMAIHHIWP